MTSIVDSEVLLTLVEAWEAQTERLRNRRLGSTKKIIIADRERTARIARAALPWPVVTLISQDEATESN